MFQGPAGETERCPLLRKATPKCLELKGSEAGNLLLKGSKERKRKKTINDKANEATH